MKAICGGSGGRSTMWPDMVFRTHGSRVSVPEPSRLYGSPGRFCQMFGIGLCGRSGVATDDRALLITRSRFLGQQPHATTASFKFHNKVRSRSSQRIPGLPPALIGKRAVVEQYIRDACHCNELSNTTQSRCAEVAA